MAEERQVRVRLSVVGGSQFSQDMQRAGQASSRLGQDAQRAAQETERSSGRIGRSLGGLGKAAAGAFAGLAIGSYLTDSIDAASDLNETLNKSSTIFGAQAKAMEQWASGAAQNLGLSKAAALDSAAAFGDMFSQLGFAGDQAAKMSQSTVQLAADLGSFNNLGTDEVLDKISGAMRGEYDSLQALIPNINAARVEKEALTATGKRSAAQLTAQEKATATLAIITKDSARAQGDFAKTSDGLANSQKILQARMEDQKATIGQALLPIMQTFVQLISDYGVPALAALGKVLGIAGDVLKPLAGLVKGAADGFSNLETPVKVALGLLAGIAALKLAGVFTAIKAGAGAVLSPLRSLQMQLATQRELARTTGQGFSTMGSLMRTAGSGIRGFGSAMLGAVGGPGGLILTAALSAVTFGITKMMQAQQRAKEIANQQADAQRGIITALNDANGALDENVRRTALANIQNQGWGRESKDLTDYAARLGDAKKYLTQMVDAQLGNAGAAKTLEDAYQRQRTVLQGVISDNTQLTADGIAQRNAVADKAAQDLQILDEMHSSMGGLVSTSADLKAGQEATAAAIKGTGDAATAAKGPVQSMSQILGFDQMAAQIGQVATQAGQLAEKAATAKTPVELMADAISAIGDEASAADTSTQFLQLTLDRLAGRNSSAEQLARANAAAIRDVGAAAREEAEAKARVDEVDAKLQQLRKSALTEGETQAQRTAAIAQAERDLAAAKDGVKSASDRQADSMDKAAKAAASQADTVYRNTLANKGLEAATAAGVAEMAKQRKAFIDTAVAAGVPQKEAEKLADKYGLIPKNVKTAFAAETKAATDKGASLYRVYDPLQGKFVGKFMTAGDAQAKTNAGNVVQKYDQAKGTWQAYLKADNLDATKKITETANQIAGLTGKKLKITYEGTLDPTFGSKSKMAAVATGGFMRGPGTGTSDDIPAWLSNGEFVMNANATKRFRPLLEHLNWNVAPAFASGGYLGAKGTDVKWDIGGTGLPPNFDSMTIAAGKGMAKAAGDALKSMLLLGGGAFAPGSGNWGPENMSGLAQNTAAALAFIKSTFGINNIGGWRASGSVAASDHPKGKALDVMINGWSSPAGIQQGNKVAAYFTGNPSAYGTKYVIWRNQINKGGGWGPYIRSDGGNATDPTLAHMDHVHISFLSGPSGPMGGGGGAEPAGSGVERWRPLANRVALAKGVPLYAVDHMMRQMNRESSGNPKAINLYDINARRGTPSKGLLQFIDPTFRRYADPGYNTNIWDPESQMRAFFNYVPSVYGSFEALQRRGYGAYASGGLVGGKGTGTSDSNVARVSRGEYIVNAKATSENLGLLHAINNGVARFATGGLVGRSALMGNSPRQLGDRESNIANAISDLLEFQKSFRAAANELISASNEAAKAAARHRGELRSQEASSKRAVYEARRAAAARVKEAEASSAAARRAVTAAERRKATSRTGQQRAAATKALASAQTRAAQVERSLSIIRRQQASEVAKVVAAEQRKVAASRAEQAALDKTAQRNASAAEAAQARAAAENRSIEVSHRWRSQLASAGRAMDNLNARLTATKDRLGDVKDQIKSTLADRSSAISQMAGQIGGTELTGNRDTRNTASRFLQGMRYDTGQLVQLNTDNAKLSRLGLNNSALQQLSQLGDGASVLHMLARTGSAGQIKAINAELAKQSRIATAVATRTIAPQFSGELAALTRGAAVTQQTLTALTREQLRTTQMVESIADRMAKAAAMAGTVASKAELAQLERDLRKLVAQR